MNYIEGDLFKGIVANYSDKITLVPHITNNVKKWGAGFVIPLAAHFPEARAAFFDAEPAVKGVLGNTQFVQAHNVPVIICNMFAQEGVGIANDGKPPIRYNHLQTCMYQVRGLAKQLQSEGKEVVISCPMFGSGLSGGNPDTIAEMIFNIWSECGINTDIYYLPQFLPQGFKIPNKLTLLARRLQSHYDESTKAGSVSVGVEDGVLHVYEQVRGISHVLPAWLSDKDVPVEFQYVGVVGPANGGLS